MHHAPERPEAPCVGLQQGLPVGLFARWTIWLANLPTKPLHAGGPCHIPLREIDDWT